MFGWVSLVFIKSNVAGIRLGLSCNQIIVILCRKNVRDTVQRSLIGWNNVAASKSPCNVKDSCRILCIFVVNWGQTSWWLRFSWLHMHAYVLQNLLFDILSRNILVIQPSSNHRTFNRYHPGTHIQILITNLSAGNKLHKFYLFLRSYKRSEYIWISPE